MMDSISLSIILWLQSYSPHPVLDEWMVRVTQLGDPILVFLFIAPVIFWCYKKNHRSNNKLNQLNSLSSSTASSSSSSSDVALSDFSLPSPSLSLDVAGSSCPVRLAGLELMLALISSDWVNAMLKWPARGDRPFWHDPRVKEFSVTCESGFGMPSGHVMCTTAAIYVLVSHIPSNTWRRIAAAIATGFVILIAITRMFVGAHFIGQVLLGAVMGFLNGYIVVHFNYVTRIYQQLELWLHQPSAPAASSTTDEASVRGRKSKQQHLYGQSYWRNVFLATSIISFLMLSFCQLEFLILNLLGQDPMDSIRFAREGCEATQKAMAAAAAAAQSGSVEEDEGTKFQKEKGPFMGVVRDAGIALGFGLSLAALIAWRIDHTQHFISRGKPKRREKDSSGKKVKKNRSKEGNESMAEEAQELQVFERPSPTPTRSSPRLANRATAATIADESNSALLSSSAGALGFTRSNDARQVSDDVEEEEDTDDSLPDEFDYTCIGLTVNQWYGLWRFFKQVSIGLIFSFYFRQVINVAFDAFIDSAMQIIFSPSTTLYIRNYIVYAAITICHLLIVPIMLKVIG